MDTSIPSAALFGDPRQEVLEGEVLKVVFADSERGWAVIRLRLTDPPRRVTAVGSLYGVQPGETLRLSGQWDQDPKFGRQFRVESFLSLMPSTVDGIERFLGSGMISGIGPVMAKRLVERFGLQTLEVIDHRPARLEEVPGIGRHRAEKIRQGWQRQKGIRDIIVFLQSHGLTVNQAVKIHRRYGGQAVAAVRANPYRLAEDIFGFGFHTADQIASKLGFDRDSPARMQAGLLHELTRAEARGHAYLPARRLVDQTTELLGTDEETVRAALSELQGLGKIIGEPDSDTKGEPAVYSPALFTAETRTATRMLELLNTGPVPSASGSAQRARLAEIASELGFELSDRQREAVLRSLAERVLVITGGPGTGKTTLIRAVVELHQRENLRIQLAAPTGRAARRLSEATGQEARTLHRLLEFEPRGGRFQRHRLRPLEADLVIIDETSMLDLVLASRLVDALPDHCRLILVGDVDQLPSVGPGRFLADLIDSRQIPVVALDRIFRQAARSLIVENAHRIRTGHMPRLETSRRVDFYLIERDQPEAVVETIGHLVAERLPQSFGFDPRHQIQVLAPMRRGPIGVDRLNQTLQELHAAGQSTIAETSGRFRIDDRVMQIRNNYELEIFNGDIGHVIGPGDGGEHLLVDFYGRTVAYPVADLDELVLAYACSIHKSQGSEYPCVIVPLHTSHYIMLQRNLLYTAVTRGQEAVIVVGEKRALAQAVRNDRQQERFTRLARRLQQAQLSRSGSSNSDIGG